MSQGLRQRIFDQLDELVLIDPHTHIDPRRPAAETLGDLLGYHYYTELAHSAGMPRAEIEAPEISAREKVGRLVAHLGPLQNTVQYSWLIELSRVLLDFDAPALTADNWESLFDRSVAQDGGTGVGRRSAAEEPPRGGLFDQRLR